MATEERTNLSRKELKRLDLANRFLRKEIRRRQMAELLGITERQVSRIVARVKVEQERGVIHRSRGRKPNNLIAEETKRKAIKLCRERYVDFGPTLAAEKLAELDKIIVSRETLRQWLIAAEMPYRRRRYKPHRQWRERKACFGEMIQMDGSRHDWFEGRGPECTLMGYIDDATGVVFARFYEYEGTVPAMDGFRRYVAEYGLPASVYLDRHRTYKGHGAATLAEELNGEGPLSQFERALKELGVEVIHALSPQAKGRIERLFGTFQDRVIKEMRLENVSSIAEGNRFLEKYLVKHNRRYRRAARESQNLHREKPGYQEMLRILSVREERTVKNDSTVWHDGRIYLLKNRTWSKKVVVERRLDGRLVIRDRNRELAFEDITAKVKASGTLPEPPAEARPPRGAVKVREAHLTWG